MYTLTIVFNKARTKVLMCYHEKQHAYNFIGGKQEEGESENATSYRELQEETGITMNSIDLYFVRRESVTTGYGSVWSMYITAGILKEDFEVVEEKNKLLWVDITEREFLLKAFGYGNCFTFLNEALTVLALKEGLCNE